MICLRCSRGFAAAIPSLFSRAVETPVSSTAKRTFTSITPLRPTLSSFRPTTLSTASAAPETLSGAVGAVDLLPKISTHPALGATQVRCGPRNTFSPSHFVRKRRHGFLSRIRTRKGRAILLRRQLKKRSSLSH